MYRRYYLLLFLTLACVSNPQAWAGQKLRVFFIGNSYTYTNDLPGMIADIAASLGDTLVHDEHTPGGWTLKDHWNPPTDPCVAKVKTGNWDYVVLQEQSQMPAFGVLNPSHPTYIYAGQFSKLIRDSAKCTMPMFYMTWGYKNGDPSNCPGLLYMCTYEGMDSVLRMRYMELADSFDAVVSPAGAVRRYIRQNHPGIELYQSDGSHPSEAGTYAAACCFYAALFRKDPSATTFNSTLSATDASIIKAAAKTVVFDSLSKWGLGIQDLSAGYDHSISGTTVTFTNKSSLKAQTYKWDFGDGSTSTLKNPVHTYLNKGVYYATLTAYDAQGCSRVVSNTVNLLITGIGTIKHAPFTVTPNPARGLLTIRSTERGIPFNIRITNALGQTMYLAITKGSNAETVDLSSFSDGLYYITLYTATAILHHGKFMKQ